MIRLGLRLAVSGGRGSIASLGLTAVAVALGTAILLFALSFGPALQDRTNRAAWRAPDGRAPSSETPTTGLLMQVIGDRYRDEPLIRVHVGALGTAPVPPGIPRVPRPGEAFVSPALAARIASVPTDELGDRIGNVVGTIADVALRSPQELVAIVGTDPTVLQANGAVAADGFRATPTAVELPPIVILMIILAVAGALAPVAVFVATATRLSAARREHRLAALRLVGATPRQVTVLAVIEALVPTVVGAIAGIALFLLVRPLVALLPLDEATWFPYAIEPPIIQAFALILAVPVVGAVAAAVSLRRLVVTPLGVKQRVTPPPPRALRLIPLAVSVAVLLGTLGMFRSSTVQSTALLAIVGLAFGGIIGGIALAGPWLTALVGRVLHRWPAGASTLLAARRLTDDPRASFGSIAGVIMAVFVASVFFTFVGYARGQSGPSDRDSSGLVNVGLPSYHTPDGVAVAARLGAAPGVQTVMAVAEAELFVKGSPIFAWVVRCQQVVDTEQLQGATCGTTPVHQLYGEEILPGTYQLAPEREAPDGRRASVKMRIRAGDVEYLVTDRVRTFQGAPVPNILIEPSALGEDAARIPVSALVVTTDGSPGAVDRVRTAVVNAAPTSRIDTGTTAGPTEAIFAEFGRVVQIGLLATLILAGCSLAVAVTTGVLERRRQFMLLRSAGMPVSRLRASLLLQAGVPLLAVAVFSALLGIGVAQAVLRLISRVDVPLPDVSLAWTLGASLLSALGIVALTFPPLERLTRPDAVRLE